MGRKKIKSVIGYARQAEAVIEEHTMVGDVIKFENLNKLIEKAKYDKVDAIVVTDPTVLGDDYTELVINLRKIGRAGLAVVFVIEG